MALPVSIVVVSRGRPDSLMRTLTGLGQLDYPTFEIVVVACPEGLAATASHPHAAHLKTVAFDTPNISVARNLGIAQAAGEVVAFIDDDAVPEPLWLRHLIAPFETETELAATGGFVRGRNGISFQWRARTVDDTGDATPLDVSETQPTVLHPVQGRAIKTEGTNMAVRRDVLAEMGGFDPAFHFYLDETDLNMRLAKAGHSTAIVPFAQVHHGFSKSPRRAQDRSPRDLFDIGASQQAFLRKHCPRVARDPAWSRVRAAQRQRLLHFMQRGPFDALDVTRLMRRLDQGAEEGRARDIGVTPPIARASVGFRPFPGHPGAPRVVIAGRVWQARQKRAEAHSARRDGAVVSLLLLDPSARYHTRRFTDDGVWEQTGGLLGRSVRAAPLLQLWRFDRRVAAEMHQLAPVRGHVANIFP